MARTVAQIQSQIIAQLNTTLPALNSPSQVAIYNLLAYVMAVAISITENLRDAFIIEIESDLASAPPGTPLWIINMCKYFQYSATTPQVATVDLSTYTISYPVINNTLNVVANAAVITNSNKQVLIKVAPANSSQVFDGAPGISGPTMQALTTYLDLINFAGVEFTLVNANPDLFLIGANIFYDGQYSGTIQAAVNTAINNYLATLPFNGLITLYGSPLNPGLYDAIANVPGVDDVEFTNVAIRANTVSLDDATLMVDNQQTIYRNNGTFSGRAIIDTTNQGSGLYVLNFNVSN